MENLLESIKDPPVLPLFLTSLSFLFFFKAHIYILKYFPDPPPPHHFGMLTHRICQCLHPTPTILYLPIPPKAHPPPHKESGGGGGGGGVAESGGNYMFPAESIWVRYNPPNYHLEEDKYSLPICQGTQCTKHDAISETPQGGLQFCCC